MTSDDTLNRFADFLDDRLREAEGVDPALDETVRRLHALDARDREPEPRPQFLSRLQEDLMNQALTMPTRSPESRVPSTEHPSSVFRLPPSASPPRRLWPNLAAAAIVLLALGAGLLAYRLAPNGSDETPTLPAAAQGTPAVEDESTAVDIAECELTVRLGVPAETPPATTALLPRFAAKEPPVDPATVLADLPEADGDTVAGVGATVRQWTACRFYAFPFDDETTLRFLGAHHFPLYSDDYVRRETGEDGRPPAFWVPIGPTPMQIIDLRLLPDGRAVALLGWTAPDQGPAQPMLAVFAQDGDHWLIDEIAYAAPDGGASGTPAAAVPDGSAQFLEVAAWDDGALYSAFPAELPFAANEQLVVTLANVGTMPHRLQIAALGIDAEAQPGHSVTVVLIPAEGSYEVISSVVGEDGQSTQATSKTLLFARQGDGTPSPPQG